jgi:hypothetical protein
MASPIKRLLSKSQGNEVHSCIQNAGMSPDDFSMGEVRWSVAGVPFRVNRLTHTISHFHFDFYPMSGQKCMCKYSPGDYAAEWQSDGGVAWSSVLAFLGRWLLYLSREVLAPDLWAGDVLAGVTVSFGDELHNEPMTEADIRDIERRVIQARAYILDSGLRDEQLAQIDEKLAYLVAATGRIGRFDWRNLAVGIVVDIAIAAAFSPQQAQNLLNLLVGTVQRLVGS